MSVRTSPVKRQLVRDVEIGAYPSGGIDSGSISAIASKEIHNLKNFTIGFHSESASEFEKGFDKRILAKETSAYLKTNHFQKALKYSDMEIV